MSVKKTINISNIFYEHKKVPIQGLFIIVTPSGTDSYRHEGLKAKS